MMTLDYRDNRMGKITDSTRSTQGPRRIKRVLVVEDERDLNELIGLHLQRNGFEVISSFNGNDAVERARTQQPDLIVLDIMLPGIDGNEVTRQLKSDPKTAVIPIIMLTARSEEVDVVVGLKLGADDYMTKPFSMKILLARLESLARRLDQGVTVEKDQTLTAGPLQMDSSRHEVAVNGEQVRLTLTEFKLLWALVEARGRVLSRDQLMDKGMGMDVSVTDRAIDVHITSIRRKLGDAARLVHTVRGVGYRLREEGGDDE